MELEGGGGEEVGMVKCGVAEFILAFVSTGVALFCQPRPPDRALQASTRDFNCVAGKNN